LPRVMNFMNDRFILIPGRFFQRFPSLIQLQMRDVSESSSRVMFPHLQTHLQAAVSERAVRLQKEFALNPVLNSVR